MPERWPDLTYERALKAYNANQKLYEGDRVYLVRPIRRESEEGLVLWVTDERTLGDHGLVLFSDGRIEEKVRF